MLFVEGLVHSRLVPRRTAYQGDITARCMAAGSGEDREELGREKSLPGHDGGRVTHIF